MKERIGYFLLKRQLKDKSRKQLFVGMKKSKRIGILFNATDYNNYLTVTQMAKQLTKADKKVEILGYSHTRVKDARYICDNNHTFICKRDFNWQYKTSDTNTLKFIETPFDILLVVSDKAFFPIKYIGHLSHAHFKVSRKSLSDDIFDFMIEFPDKEPSLNEQLEQMFHYLDMLSGSGSEKKETISAETTK